MIFGWRAIAIPFVVIVLAAAVFFGGRHTGADEVQRKWNAQKLIDQSAVAQELVRQAKKASEYAAQIQLANDERDKADGALARLMAAPPPRIVCHTAANRGGALSGSPEKGSGQGSGPNAPGNVRGSDFDPSIDERKLHYAFAVSYAACIDQLNRWPN